MPRKPKTDPQAMSPIFQEMIAPSSALLTSSFDSNKPSWLRGDSVTSGMDISPTSNISAPIGLGLDLAVDTTVEDPEDVLLASRHEIRQGRRYLRDVPYLLPCDLAEMHRQSLRTLLGIAVFSGAVCSPSMKTKPPRKVLELGCGSAFWTSTCHDYLKRLGLRNVSFTGIDIASIAPDLSEQGIDWHFVQHDLRDMPWPFADAEFDYIMIKDLSLAFPQATAELMLAESLRVLSDGGSLEVWESDHVLRCLLPHDRLPPVDKIDAEETTASHTRTYLITSDTPFTQAQNEYIVDANTWIEQACAKRHLPSSPCAKVADALLKVPDLCNVGSRRVAIPFTELPWESEKPGARKRSHASVMNGNTPTSHSLLTPDQAAIRLTALMIFIQKIESLEPALKDFSGKNTDERATWWAGLMSNLLDQNGGTSGEVLELGAWWATKKRMKPVS